MVLSSWVLLWPRFRRPATAVRRKMLIEETAMAELRVNRAHARALILDVMTANLAYYRVRRELLDRLRMLALHAVPEGEGVVLQWRDVLAVRQVLMARNDQITDVMQYSLQAATMNMLVAIQGEQDEGEEDGMGRED